MSKYTPIALAGLLALTMALGACGRSPSHDLHLSAGPDQVVAAHTQVTLVASSNADSQRYRWAFKSKPDASQLSEADIAGADSATARFTPDVAGVYQLQVTLDTDHGGATDTVRITSRIGVSAGANRTTQGNARVELHATSNAAHPAYRWQFVSRPAGSTATLDNADSADAGFRPDVPGVYRIRSSLASGKASDVVTITAKHVRQPGVMPQSTNVMADATSFAIAPDGSPYVGYSDENEGHKAVIKKFEGGKWKKLGGTPASDSAVRFISLAISAQGTPYVAYQDFSDDGREGVTVMKFSGGKWTVVGRQGFSEGQAEYVSLAIASDGTPYVAYQTFTNDAPGGLVVRRFADGKWNSLDRAGLAKEKVRYVSLAVAHDGTPYVAYQDLADIHNGVSVRKFVNDRWVSVGSPGFSPNAATFVSLALSPKDTPYVVYEDGGPERPASVRKFDGKQWSYVGKAWFTRGEAEFDTIAVAPNGTVYVAYQDEIHNGISVRKFDGKQWQFVGEAGFSDGEAEHISFAIAADGKLYVAYRTEVPLDAKDSGAKGEHDILAARLFSGGKWIRLGPVEEERDENGEE